MKIIVGITSWNKRIEGSVKTIQSLLDQDYGKGMPCNDYTIELNLDYENFPLGYMELPVSLLELAENRRFSISWRTNDLRVWQKLIPTVWKHYGEKYILVTCDDDVTYPRTYLSEIAENMKTADWLCTKYDDATMGEYMAYGPRAVAAIAKHVNNEAMENCPLDDHLLYWVLQKYHLIRGKKIQSIPVDRQEGYSFRRYFVDVEDPSKLLNTSCNYPKEEFIRERAYMHKVGIV